MNAVLPPTNSDIFYSANAELLNHVTKKSCGAVSHALHILLNLSSFVLWSQTSGSNNHLFIHYEVTRKFWNRCLEVFMTSGLVPLHWTISCPASTKFRGFARRRECQFHWKCARYGAYDWRIMPELYNKDLYPHIFCWYSDFLYFCMGFYSVILLKFALWIYTGIGGSLELRLLSFTFSIFLSLGGFHVLLLCTSHFLNILYF